MTSTADETTTRLSDRDLEILAFERTQWRFLGAKEAAVRDRFDMSMTRYAQIVNSLIDLPEAVEVDAQLVHRLRRLRDARQQQRSPRRC